MTNHDDDSDSSDVPMVDGQFDTRSNDPAEYGIARTHFRDSELRDVVFGKGRHYAGTTGQNYGAVRTVMVGRIG